MEQFYPYTSPAHKVLFYIYISQSKCGAVRGTLRQKTLQSTQLKLYK
jgi:hypothetical protein